MGFELDPKNFGAGLLAGWISAYGVYRSRHVLSAIRQSLTQQAASAQSSVMRSADSRYFNDLIAICETTHLAGRLINLSEIVVEPRFITAPKLAAPPEDDVVQNVFYVVPQVPDYPYLHAPYNIETISIEELGRGDRAIALLGHPGSGRTTALLTIALWGMERVRFDPPKDKVQERLEEEEASLPREDRERHIKERLRVEESARSRLASERGEEYDDDNQRKAAALSVFKQLMPVYVHLANVNVSPQEFGRQADPAEPLVRAVQHPMKRITAKTLPRNLYKRLNNGEALLLIDGYDDLPENERYEKLTWLEEFVEQYRHNFMIVTGPAQGYGKLAEMDLTPVFMRPWNDVHVNRLVDKWAHAWPSMHKGRRRGGPKLDETLIEQAKTECRGLSPFDLTLKTWEMFAEETDSGFDGRLRAYLERTLPDPSGDVFTRLAQAAALQLNEGFITLARLTDIATADGLSTVPVPEKAETAMSETVQAATEVEAPADESFDLLDEDADELDDLFEGGDEAEDNLNQLFEAVSSAPDVSLLSQPEPSSGDKKELARISKEVSKLFKALQRNGLLVSYRGGRYQLRHRLTTAYLASLTLQDVPDEQLAQYALNPAWSETLAYAGAYRPIDTAVSARLNTPTDVLLNNLLAVSRWLAYAGPDVTWRNDVLVRLGNLFVTGSQYSVVRERIAAALVGTRFKGVLKVFTVALENPNPDIRRLACLALGAFGEPKAIEMLSARLQDAAADVQLAAGLALGAIGTEEALEEMVDGLTIGSEQLRQAIAEAFAALPEEGYPVLYDAVQHEDMNLRRAAIFGLRRLRTTWALVSIYRASLEDPQWYVKSAAQQAFQYMEMGEGGRPKAYPPVETLPWMQEWLVGLGDQAPQSQESDELLISALGDDEPLVRKLSAATMGQLGLVSTGDALYNALLDPEDAVRDAAHRALAHLQMHMGEGLPSPT